MSGNGEKVRVKPLDWQETFVDRGDGGSDLSGWEANNGFDSWYNIEQYFASDSYGWTIYFDYKLIADCDDPEVAKEQAQQHFSAVILAALQREEG